MPNWTRNKIIVGSKDKLNVLVKDHCPLDRESGYPEMDFNTIKRMPEEMNIEYGSRSNDGIKLALARKNPDVDFYGSKEDKLTPLNFEDLQSVMSEHAWLGGGEPLTKEQFESFKAKYKEDFAKVEELGEKCIYNVEKFGSMNWYEWSLSNWGTKWNATNTNINEEECSISFDTAWDPAIPAIIEISKKHPKIPMVAIWGDEQTGAKVGFMMLTNGRIDHSGAFKDFSPDAYQMAFKVWDNGDEYEFDEKKGNFVRKDLIHQKEQVVAE